MAYDIPHDQSVILNFFSGKVFFVFKNEEEVKSFLNFIRLYDDGFEKSIKKLSDFKSAMWRYDEFGHRHRLEWAVDSLWFARYGINPIDYSIVKGYADAFSKMSNTFKKIMETLRENIVQR